MSTATSDTGQGAGTGRPAGSAAAVDSAAAADQNAGAAAGVPRFRSDAAADRVMRRLLGVDGLDPSASTGAHRAFRTSVLVSAVRCLITYLLIPILVPLLSLSGWVAAPIGIVLCVIAVVNGVVSVRRFWVADHPRRWVYTGFMAVVFVILGVAMVSELHRMGVM
ncbi:hypothetical protein [Dietzia aurantiaca]|uniref:Uncharacterized protein n=1 Tax=Dietzia aurantiaca TaxID=983873 RepID=A0ABV9PUI4_9ACTN